MKQFAAADICLSRPRPACSRRCPDPTLYEGGLDGCGVASGVLPCAGAAACNSGLLMR